MGSPRLYTFLVAVIYAGHLYIWSRLATAAALEPRWPLAVAGLAALAAASVGVLLALRRHAPLVYRYAKWAVSTWVGVFAYGVSLLALGHIVELSGAALGLWTPGRVAPLTVGLPGLGALVILAWGLFEAARPPRVRTLEVALPGLPADAEGLCAVQISDVHLSRLLTLGSVRRLVAGVNALEPDLVLLTGDAIDARDEVFPDRDRFLSELANLSGRLGCYAITGNHEFYSRGRESASHLVRFGFILLANQVAEPVPGLLLAGLHDISSIHSPDREMRTGPADFAKILGPEVQRKPTILLYHQPVHAETFAELGVDLMLSGHTHAGQLLPFGRLSKRDYTRFKGSYRIGDLLLYVSPGVGCSGPPFRIGARREVTRVILFPGDDPSHR